MEDKDLKQEPDNRPEEVIESGAAPDVPAESAGPIAETESAPSCGEAVEAAEAPSDGVPAAEDLSPAEPSASAGTGSAPASGAAVRASRFWIRASNTCGLKGLVT